MVEKLMESNRIEAGVQLHLPTYSELSMVELTGIATSAAQAGFDQIWVTDNLHCRNTFVVLAAFAPVVEAKLGTAIMAQYFRSPVESARALMTVSELMDGRELTVGIGTGNPHTSRLIEMPRRVGFMKQTMQCLRQLLAGKEVLIDDYPILGDYFRFAPGALLHVSAQPAGPITLYGGGNGPKGLALAGELMDGLIFGWTTKLNETLGRLKGKLDIVSDAANAAARESGFRRVTEVKIAVAADHEVARDFVRRKSSCGRKTLGMRKRGYTDDDYIALGINPDDVNALDRASQVSGPYTDFGDLVTDGMIDASYIAGSPDYCAERMIEFAAMASERGFDQVIFSELGPDPVIALELLSEHVLPVLNR